MSGYFIAPDWDREPTLWRGEPDDAYPVAVLTRRQLADDPDVWAALVKAVRHVEVPS